MSVCFLYACLCEHALNNRLGKRTDIYLMETNDNFFDGMQDEIHS